MNDNEYVENTGYYTFIESENLDAYDRLRSHLFDGTEKPTDEILDKCIWLERFLGFQHLVYTTKTDLDKLPELLYALRGKCVLTRGVFTMVKAPGSFICVSKKDEAVYKSIIDEGYNKVELYDYCDRLWGIVKILPNGFCFSVRENKLKKAEKMMNSLLGGGDWTVLKYEIPKYETTDGESE